MTGPRVAPGIVGGGGWLGSALVTAVLDAGLVDVGSLRSATAVSLGGNADSLAPQLASSTRSDPTA